MGDPAVFCACGISVSNGADDSYNKQGLDAACKTGIFFHAYKKSFSPLSFSYRPFPFGLFSSGYQSDLQRCNKQALGSDLSEPFGRDSDTIFSDSVDAGGGIVLQALRVLF